MSHLTDDQLLQRFAESRDAEAFGALVGRHMGLVHATCRRETGDDALAEDAAQTTFLTLARKAAALRAERSLAAWLFATARLTARNLRRQERRRRDREARAAAETERTMHDEEIEPRLNEALAALRPADRDAVILRYLEGRSLAEVAAELNVAESAARMRVQRALERLRLGLGRVGVAASAAALLAALDRQASAAVPPRLLAVSVPPAASSGAGTGARSLLTKGTTLLLATNTTKAFVASGVALVAAGGFVFVRSRPALDDATVRAALRPLVGTWQGTASVPGPPDGRRTPTPMRLEAKPEKDGLGLSVTMRFPEMHQGERKHLAFDAAGRLVVTDATPTVEIYEPKGLREFARRGRGLLAFEGRAHAPEGDGDIKVSFEAKDGRLTMRQSSKPDGRAEQSVEVVLERTR